MKINSTLTSKKTMIIHLIFWGLYIYFNLIKYNRESNFYVDLSHFSITWFVVFFLTFYLNYLVVLPKVFKLFNWKKALIGLTTLYLFFIVSRFFLEQFLTAILFDQTNYFPDTNIIYYAFDNIYFGSQPIIISTVFWMVVAFIRLSEYNASIIEANKNAEIKFLRAQINPHFVFNTLNTIYSMVYFQSEKSLTAIEKLSQIMRFTTYESQKEKIRLSDEIDYINAYIELEQLRHQENSFVHFDIKTDNESIEILPYILSPLVENALKHGITSDAKPIGITLASDAQKLRFTIENEIGTQKKDKLGGIGLDNLKKRLEIHYPNRHSLILANQNNRFIAKLEIDLR